jgi:hypothetical protein
MPARPRDLLKVHCVGIMTKVEPGIPLGPRAHALDVIYSASWVLLLFRRDSQKMGFAFRFFRYIGRNDFHNIILLFSVNRVGGKFS